MDQIIGRTPSGPEPGAAAAGPLLRVERGRPTDEELAVLTAVLLSRAAADAAAEPGPAPARWLRLERGAAFRVPHSWQMAA